MKNAEPGYEEPTFIIGPAVDDRLRLQLIAPAWIRSLIEIATDYSYTVLITPCRNA